MRTAVVLLAAWACMGAPSARDLQREAAVALKAGALERALREAEIAVALARREGDKRAAALALNTAGEALLYRGEYETAAQRFEEAVRLSTEAGDTRHAVDQLANAGSARYFQGRYDEAYRFYREAQSRTASHAGEPWATEMARVNAVNMATLLQRLGMLREALTIYKEQSGQPDLSPGARAQLASNLGALYRRLGDPWLAREEYRKAARLAAGTAASDLRLGILKNQAIVEALDLRNPRAAETTLRQVLQIARREGNAREMTQALLYLAELHKREGRLEDAAAGFRQALDGSRKLNAPEEEWKAIFGLGRHLEAIDAIEKLRSGVGDSRLRSRFLSDKRDPYDARISLRLREGAGFAELFDLAERSRSRALSDKLVPTIARAEAVRSRLGANTILLSQWRHENESAVLWCTRGESGVARNLDGIAPLADAAITRLILVPDGALETSPDVLTFRGSRLVSRFEIAVLPAASLLLRQEPEAPFLGPWSAGFTGIGAPGPEGERLAGDQRWTALPRAREELRDAETYLPGASRVFTGTQATRANLLSNAGRGFVLHFATHAAADVESPDRSRILLNGSYLYHSEIASLPLTRNHLTVLSACETERGEDVRGEGVQSLGSAFLAAGSASVITTLWRVDDNAAAEMMKGFYGALAKGGTKAGALREAKLRLIRSGTPLADPKHWSAFVLIGDGWSPLPRVVPWSAILAAAAAVSAIGLWWARSRRGSAH